MSLADDAEYKKNGRCTLKNHWVNVAFGRTKLVLSKWRIDVKASTANMERLSTSEDVTSQVHA
jgi:hypothetical protein